MRLYFCESSDSLRLMCSQGCDLPIYTVLSCYLKWCGELNHLEQPLKVKQGSWLAYWPLIRRSAFQWIGRLETGYVLRRRVVKTAARRGICAIKATDVNKGQNHRNTRSLLLAFAARRWGVCYPACAGQKVAERSTGFF